MLIFLSLAMFGNYYFYDALSPLADLLQSSLHFTAQTSGCCKPHYSFPNIFTVVIGGIIIDRIGTRKATLIFGVLCLIGAVMTSSAASFPVMARAAHLRHGRRVADRRRHHRVAKWFKGKELSFAFGFNLMFARVGSFAGTELTDLGQGALTRTGAIRC